MSQIRKVACALLAQKGSLLIQKRSEIAKYGEEWSFFGGGIEESETPRQALFREIREELDLDITDWNIREGGEIIHTLPDYNLEYHRFLFLIEIPDNVSVFSDREGSGAHFFPIDRLHELRFNTDISEEMAFLKTFSL